MRLNAVIFYKIKGNTVIMTTHKNKEKKTQWKGKTKQKKVQKRKNKWKHTNLWQN